MCGKQKKKKKQTEEERERVILDLLVLCGGSGV